MRSLQLIGGAIAVILLVGVGASILSALVAAPPASVEIAGFATGLKLRSRHQHVPCGLENERHGGSFLEREPLWIRKAICLGCANKFGAAAGLACSNAVKNVLKSSTLR